MSARQVIWARSKREELFLLLGGCCRECGCGDELTFDCIEPQGDWHHRIGFTWRMSYYRQQHVAGNLQLLCVSCNSRKGNTPPADA